MRASEIENWLECERYAVAQAQVRESGYTLAAALVGTLAHGVLAGDIEIVDRMKADAERPAHVWDSITPNYAVAGVQAQLIAAAARAELDRQGWGIVQSEQAIEGAGVRGRYDMLAWHSEHGDAIVELKTGRSQPRGAWLQVAAYIAGSERQDIRYGGVLTVPRPKLSEYPKPSLEFRRASALLHVWAYQRARIEEVLNGKEALRRPGVHCGRCRVAGCAVRAS